jgi:hypothetical protein
MTPSVAPELTTFRWSSNDEAHRFSVEDLAHGWVIAASKLGRLRNERRRRGGS